ncbi:uncharacterized protein [Apostichopus japonicus]|uniref:uncharacterized protein n=1 Tax=Stichopus japonicus TaxID=307972 RepID=UPI003AB25BDD
MAYSTRSKAKTETVSQFPVVSDQHCSTSGSVSQRDTDEILKKLREVKLLDIKKKKKESNELPPKGSAVKEKLKRTEKEGEELQTNTERERDGERRGEQKKVKVEHDKPEASCKPKEEPSDGNLKELSAKKEQPTRQKVMELQGTLDDWKQTIERYKECIAVISFTLALTDDRSVSSCSADIRKANDAFKEEMEREFAHLESPASTKVKKEQEAKTAQDVKKVKITNPKMDIVDFATLLESGMYPITSITELSVGKMVISGAAPDRQSHITVIDSKGKKQDMIKMEGRSDIHDTHRYCCSLSEEKVLTVYGTQKVAIYDVCKRVQCTSSSAPGDKCMSCVAYDPNEPKYIVCYGRAKTFDIFDDELRYSRNVKLPKKEFGTVNDIAVHGSFLLVCHNKGAHAITLNGKDATSEFELKKPTHQVRAIGVCIGNYSFIYMLWSDDKNFKTTLCQYSKDGRELLLEMPLGKLKNGCLTTLDVDGTERLVIASNDPAILHSFQLIAEE